MKKRNNPNPNHNPKENPATKITPLNPAERRYVEAVYAHLCKAFGHKVAKANQYGLQPHDIAGFAIEKVINNIALYQARYKTPLHAANAIATNAFIDAIRREWAQRGQGARGTRGVLGDIPVKSNEPDGASILDNFEGSIVDSEQWIEDDYRRRVIGEVRGHISTLAWEGLVLTEINGLTQTQAAVILGVSRAHLNREISKAKKIAKRMHEDHNWEVN